MGRDRGWLYFAVFVRSLATGMIGVLLGIHLSELHLGVDAIGVIVGIGLGGAALATLLATLYADVAGHRRTLLLISLASFAGAVLLTFSAHPLALGFAALIGMVNGMGRDRGAALVVEQAALPATTSDRERTMVFAKYNVLQDISHALGFFFHERFGVGVAAIGLLFFVVDDGRLSRCPATTRCWNEDRL